jgi:hypothetical protein
MPTFGEEWLFGQLGMAYREPRREPMTNSFRWWEARAARWTEGQLKSHTIDYWNLKKPSAREGEDESSRIHWYITTLLPEELSYAFSQPDISPPARCDTLAVLVGHSPEPLLQAISVFEPDRLVLVLNRLYGRPGSANCQTGEERGRQVHGWIGKWLAPLLERPPSEVCRCTTADQPNEVFHALNDAVLHDQRAGKQVVVDITGAKKNMVAGAFLLAAYAEVQISYVDFDDYEPRARRPYGFSCRVGVLDNPYAQFRLRDWERVRRLYQGTHFRAARHSLPGAMAAMRQHDGSKGSLGLFSREAMTAAKRLRLLLRLYEAWDDGNHRRAFRCLIWLNSVPLNGQFHPPQAITALGSEWPHTAGEWNSQEGAARALLNRQDRLEAAMFEDNRLLLAYARDELAKVRRLLDANEDNRSAFMRAAGLDEFLLKARLVRLWNRDKLWIRSQDEGGMWEARTRSYLSPDLQETVLDSLLRFSGVDPMRRMLARETRDGGYPFDLPLRYGATDKAWAQMDRHSRLALAPYWQDAPADLKPETLQVLRNKSIHMSLYVTRALAAAACEQAERNLAEFEKSWAPLAGAMEPKAPDDTEPLPWTEVCTLFGLDFLPLAPKG